MDRIINLPKEWLYKKTSMEEEFARLDDLSGSVCEDMREDMCKELTEIASEMGVPDELWWYNSGDDSWDRMCGSAGFAIVRDGEIVAAYQIIMN